LQRKTPCRHHTRKHPLVQFYTGATESNVQFYTDATEHNATKTLCPRGGIDNQHFGIAKVSCATHSCLSLTALAQIRNIWSKTNP
jgi:hypothetical protein